MFTSLLVMPTLVLSGLMADEHNLSVRGVGAQTIKPDRAVIWVYAVGDGILLTDAAADAGKKAEAISNAVRKACPDAPAPQIIAVSVSKAEKRFFSHGEKDEGRPQMIQRITFAIPASAARATEIVDAAMRAGATLDIPRSSHFAAEINSNIFYTVVDETKVQDDVIAAAIDDARVKAEKIASKLGKRLGEVVSVTVDSSQNELFVYPLERGRMTTKYIGTDPEKLDVREFVSVKFKWLE